MFSYLLKVNRLEEKIAIASQRDRLLSHIAPLSSSSASLAIMKPRNIAIFGVVAAVCVTGAMLFYHAMSTSMRAMQWVQVAFPELVRNSEPTIAKYGSLKHFETTTCSEGISYGKVNGNFEILAQCIIKASFEQADVVVLIHLKEKEQSWEIREFTMGIPAISFP